MTQVQAQIALAIPGFLAALVTFGIWMDNRTRGKMPRTMIAVITIGVLAMVPLTTHVLVRAILG